MPVDHSSTALTRAPAHRTVRCVPNRRGPYSARVKSAWILPLVIAALVGVALLVIGKNARDALVWIDHTDQVVSQAHLVELNLTDTSAAKRAYLIQPVPELFEAFHRASGRVEPAIDLLEKLVADNPEQIHRARSIRNSAREWLLNATDAVEHPPREPASALHLELFTRVRAQLEAFVRVEVGLRDRRSTRARLATTAATFSTVLLALVLALAVALSSRHALRNLASDYETILANLGAERERFRATFEYAAVGIGQVSLDGRWQVVNQRLAEITGRTRDELLRSSFQEITHPDDLERDLVEVRRVLDGKASSYEIEKRYLRKDGSIVWVNLTAALVHKEDGSPDYFISVVQDISGRVAAEDELRQLNAQLEDRVRQRTEALRAVNAELESFSYSVSHDLRAPLRSIDGFSQALEEDAADKLHAEARGFLRRIRAATRRMGELIDDLLRLSRIARMQVRRETVDVSALARAALDELRSHDPERPVEIDVEPGLRANADPRLVKIVLENLLGNAWKFTRGRAPARIEVFSSGDGAQIEFGVRDNGAGFDAAYGDQLFKPFHRLHRSEQFEGTGIGLATVRRIVHRHGGEIRAESAVGRGATFWFTLAPPARGILAGPVAAAEDARTSA